MPRVCAVCSHPERAAIESALIAGTSCREISVVFRVSEDSVQRHKQNCVKQSIAESQEAREEASALDVVKQLTAINATTLAILHEARKAKQHGLALSAIDRVQKQIELQAKLLGDIDRPIVNVWLTPEWQSIRSTIVAALLPFPDARIAVASRLAQLESTRDRLN